MNVLCTYQKTCLGLRIQKRFKRCKLSAGMGDLGRGEDFQTKINKDIYAEDEILMNLGWGRVSSAKLIWMFF